MDIKCVKCKTVEKLGQDEIEYLVNIAKRYTDNISPNDYTAILSIIKGTCTDGKKHLYIYDETFSKNIANMISGYNVLYEKNAEKEKELSSILQKIEILKNEIMNLDEKREGIIRDISDINISINGKIEMFEKETGTRDVKMWS